jgi:molybdenum cofactor guanylyltransferase
VKKFAAVLLAGGRSRRMGMSKALLDRGGTPLWRFQMEKLLTLHPHELFFSVQPGMDFPAGPWSFVYDRLVDIGPLGGLVATLQRTRAEFLLTLAVDMPAMTTEFLRFLLEKTGPTGVAPHLDGFYQGASAVYPANILPLVEQVLASDDRSFQHLICEALRTGTMEGLEIDSSRRQLFENWNSPEDLNARSGATVTAAVDLRRSRS